MNRTATIDYSATSFLMDPPPPLLLHSPVLLIVYNFNLFTSCISVQSCCCREALNGANAYKVRCQASIVLSQKEEIVRQFFACDERFPRSIISNRRR